MQKMTYTKLMHSYPNVNHMYIVQALLKLIEQGGVDLNALNDVGDAPIHAIVCCKRRKRADLLLTLLVNGCTRVDVNRPSKSSADTALHLAVIVSQLKILFKKYIPILHIVLEYKVCINRCLYSCGY